MIDKKVEDVFNEIYDNYAIGAYDKIPESFTRDAKILYPELGIIQGKEKIISFYTMAKEKVGIDRMASEVMEVEEHGEIITVLSNYTVWAADGSVIGAGNAIDVLKEEDGELKIYWDATV